MKHWPALLALLMLVGHDSAWAQIYSYVDENGQRVFTDRPPVNAKTTKVDTAPVNRMPAGQRFIKLQAPAALKQQLAPPPPPYQTLQLLSPAQDDTLRNTGGTLDVHVSSEPSLRPGHRYQAWLNGVTHGAASTASSWQITGLERGTHQLAVQILDEAGNSLLQTPTVTLHIKQTSLAERRRIRPCQLEDYGQRPECPLADKPEQKRRWWQLGF